MDFLALVIALVALPHALAHVNSLLCGAVIVTEQVAIILAISESAYLIHLPLICIAFRAFVLKIC